MHRSLGRNVDDKMSPTFVEATATKLGVSPLTLADRQKMAEAEELEAVERERAEKVRRQKISASRSGETVETLPPSQKTRDKVAAAVGLGSGRTYLGRL